MEMSKTIKQGKCNLKGADVQINCIPKITAAMMINEITENEHKTRDKNKKGKQKKQTELQWIVTFTKPEEEEKSR